MYRDLLLDLTPQGPFSMLTSLLCCVFPRAAL